MTIHPPEPYVYDQRLVALGLGNLMSRPASIILLLLFMGLLGVAWTYAPARGEVDSDLYDGFTLVDPATERVLENAYVVVSDGRLAEIGTGEAPHGQFRSRREMRVASACRASWTPTRT